MKYKYRTDGISKNKKIREHRKKPLPLELMKNDTKRCDTTDGREPLLGNVPD